MHVFREKLSAKLNPKSSNSTHLSTLSNAPIDLATPGSCFPPRVSTQLTQQVHA